MIVKLKDVCELVAGYAFKSKDFGNFDEKVIKITQINPPYVNLNGALGINLSKYNKDKLKKYLVKKGDYVFAMTGATIGKIGRLVDGQAYLNQRVLLFKPYKTINKEYLYYVLQSYEFSQYVRNHIDSESAQPNISADTVGSFEFALHSFEDQEKIAEILGSIDRKIENNNRINDNLSKQAIELFNHHFQDVFDGNLTISHYLIPRRGKQLLSKNANDGDVPVVAGGLEPSTYHNVANTKSPVITISASGANAGFVRLWNRQVWSSDSSFIDESITQDVYFWYLVLSLRQEEIYGAQTGSAQPHIYPQNIGALPMGKLNKEDVFNFNKLISPLFKQIGLNEEENNRLSKLRDLLLPRLLSGDLVLQIDNFK